MGPAPTHPPRSGRPETLRVAFVFPSLPPALDGIGDYTANLARTLAARCAVEILTEQAEVAPIPGVAVRRAFTTSPLSGVRALLGPLGEAPPDWLVLQYNPFSYGRYGFNPWLPGAIEAALRRHPGMRFGLMVHEPFVPIRSLAFGAMTTWQRWQLWRLGRAADLVLCSIEAWSTRFARWFPRARVGHLPVGSNVPDGGRSRRAAREGLGLGADDFVVGLFGSGFVERMMPFVVAALGRLASVAPRLQALYVGTRGADVRNAVGPIPFRDLGPLPASGVSEAFAAMDLYLAPYPDGVSTRRGSALVALQHGVPLLSTRGHLSDTVLTAAEGDGLALAPATSAAAFAEEAIALYLDPDRRARIGRGGQALYEASFSWERIAEGFLTALSVGGGRVPARDGVAPESALIVEG